MAVPQPPQNWINVVDLRRGRNGSDVPSSISDNECVDAVDVDWYKATLGRKRGGADSLSMLGTTLVGTISSLGRHIPTSDSTGAELWAVDDTATPIMNRLAGGTTWSVPNFKDAPTGNGWDFHFASSGGKFFVAYQSAVNRLHCWDGTILRRTGLAVPAAPTAIDTGVGTYAIILRYYRVRWTVQVAGVTTRRSEGGPSLSFTPNGNGTAVRVTQPAVPSEGETHWEVEVSLDNANFFLLSTVVIATTTYDDSTVTTSYASKTVSPAAGLYTTQPSYKFVAVDQNRLLGFGSYTAADKQNRIEISDIIGGLNISDNERVPLNSYLDLDENDSGAPVGLVGPVLGAYFAFKETQLWKLTPSGNPTTPYTQNCISKTIGAVGPHSITVGEDEFGNPCIYWVSQRGIYRFGANGLEYIGGGIADLIVGPTSTINLAATKIICHALYYSRLRQVWFWISVGSENEPSSMKLVYSAGRYGGFLSSTTSQIPSGWSRHTGASTKARASCLFSNTVGASMSRDLKPYIAYSGNVSNIWKLDTATTTDAGTAFKAFILSKAYAPWSLAKRGVINRSYLLAQASTGVTITQTLTGDFGVQTSTDTVSLTASAQGESRVVKRFEDARLADMTYVQFQWGDASAVANTWQLDASITEYLTHEIA